MKKTLVLSLFMILSSPTPLYAATPQLNVSAMKLYVGNRYTFKMKNNQDPVTWSIKNPRIASVNNKGVVTGLKAGTTTLVATIQGRHYKARVSVLRSHLDRQRVYSFVGNTTYLEVSKLWGTVPKWSANKKLFKLTAYKDFCAIKALKPGTGTIKAKVKGETYTCTITVVKALTYNDFYVKNTSKLDGYSHYFEYTKAHGRSYYWYFNEDNTNDPQDDRGIVMGSRLSDLWKAYGETTYRITFSDQADFAGDAYHNVPSSRAYLKVIYFAKLKGHMWYKIFYFDAHKKVNGIVWSNSENVL